MPKVAQALACKTVLLVMSGIALTSCVSEHRIARATPHKASSSSPHYAVTQTMQRQIANAVDAGDGDLLVRSLRERLVADPNNLAVRLQLAEHYRNSGFPELAFEHYRLAAVRFPDNADLSIKLAKSLREFDRQREAIDELVNFCNRHPQPPPELLSLLGILQDDAGELVQAERSYRAALQLAPKAAYLHNNLGYNLLLQGRAEAAVAEFQEALTIEPHSQFAHNNLGLALLAEWKTDRQPNEALLHWESISGPATAHNNLASFLIDQGRYADARKELEIALGYQKNHSAALANLQLLSGLDGKLPVVHTNAGPNGSSRSVWKRFTQSVEKVFADKGRGQPASAEQSASTRN